MKLDGLCYTSPYTFTVTQRIQLQLVPPLISGALYGISATLKMERRNEAGYEQSMADGKCVLMALWHESIGMAAYHTRGRNVHTTTSFSYDGELAARIIPYFGSEAIRGSSSRGGKGALEELVKATQKVPCIGITMDGPRGPRRVAKAGLAIIAGRTQTPIIPLAYGFRNPYRMRSWDKFAVAKPFSSVISQFGDVIPPPVDDSPEAVEAKRLEVQDTLNDLHKALEREVDDAGCMDWDTYTGTLPEA